MATKAPASQTMSAQEGDLKTDIEDRKADVGRARSTAIIDIAVNIAGVILFVVIGSFTLILQSVADIFIAIIPSRKLKRLVLVLNIFFSLLCLLETILFTIVLIPGVAAACVMGMCGEWWNIILIVRIVLNICVIMWKVVMVLVMFHATRALGKPKVIDPDRDIKIGKVYAAIHIVAEIFFALHGMLLLNPLETVICILASAIVVAMWMHPSKLPFVIQIIMLAPFIVLHFVRASILGVGLVVGTLVLGESIYSYNIITTGVSLGATAVIIADSILFFMRLVACSASVFALEELFRRRAEVIKVAPEEKDTKNVLARSNSVAKNLAVQRKASFTDSIDMTLTAEDLTKLPVKKSTMSTAESSSEPPREVKPLDLGVPFVQNNTKVQKATFPSAADEEPNSSAQDIVPKTLVADTPAIAVATASQSQEVNPSAAADNDSLSVLKGAAPDSLGVQQTASQMSTTPTLDEGDSKVAQNAVASIPTAGEPQEQSSAFQTTIKKPEVIREEPRAQPVAAADGEAAPPKKKKSKWREYKTDEGVPYYYNKETKVTQWEKPADM